MKVDIKIFHGTETTPVVTGTLEGDPIELIDLHRELNARWPGRRAEVVVQKLNLQPTG